MAKKDATAARPTKRLSGNGTTFKIRESRLDVWYPGGLNGEGYTRSFDAVTLDPVTMGIIETALGNLSGLQLGEVEITLTDEPGAGYNGWLIPRNGTRHILLNVGSIAPQSALMEFDPDWYGLRPDATNQDLMHHVILHEMAHVWQLTVSPHPFQEGIIDERVGPVASWVQLESNLPSSALSGNGRANGSLEALADAFALYYTPGYRDALHPAIREWFDRNVNGNG